ncbi:MAG TPA: Spy/CpxP family protein refolding chaperone [Thermoanaerobaculia bacterium]|jgi:Spy/CpxP family protein refolding chaperone|nr:Spy/CpxP family protein refolding chaperone [Thermoanaerobaculia bacterium]
MKKKILFSLIAALVLVTGTALAGEHFKRVVVHGDGGPDMFFEHAATFAAELGLSEDQKEAAKQIHEEVWAKAEPLMEQHHQQMEEIHALLDAGNANATEIGQKMITAHASLKQLEAAHQDGMERFKALLTEEQKAKLETMEKDHPFPHGGMRMMRHH